jgi:uncharacterized protein (DUF983 family)
MLQNEDMSDIERRGNDPARTGPVEVPPVPATGALLARGLVRRCPMCGGGDLFSSWFTMRERCPTCGLRLNRGEHDSWSGAWMLNLVGVETVFVLLMALVVIALWPDVPWRAITWLGVLGMLALPLLLYPISRTLWLAIDLSFQPARESDY